MKKAEKAENTAVMIGTKMNKREQQRDQVTMAVILLCGFIFAGCQWMVAQEPMEEATAEHAAPVKTALVATTRPPASGLSRAPTPSRRHAIRRTRAS